MNEETQSDTMTPAKKTTRAVGGPKKAAKKATKKAPAKKAAVRKGARAR